MSASTVRPEPALHARPPFHRCDPGLLKPSHLSFIMADMVSKNLAVYEPPKQTRTVLLYWRLPEEWAEVLHEWVRRTALLPVAQPSNAAWLGYLHGPAQHHPHVL